MPKEIKARLAGAREETARLPAQALLVTDPANIRYLSGFTGSEAVLLITARGQMLFTDSRYTTQAGQEAGGYKIVPVVRAAPAVAVAVGKFKIESLAFEPEGLTHARYLEFRRALPGKKLIGIGGGIRWLRAMKNQSELRLMVRAARIAARAFQDTMPLMQPGRSEIELALALENRMRELGSGAAPFATIVASGPRGALPHGQASPRRMKRGELVTVDFGSIFAGYQSDQTVTFCLGRASARRRKIYETVREAHDRAIAAIRPGVRGKEVDAVARNYIAAAGFGKFFGHGLGHGVGLMTHEEPVLNTRSQTKLEPGMVVTVEPGIYIPGFGGARIEDMVAVTSRGCRVLTASGGPLREL